MRTLKWGASRISAARVAHNGASTGEEDPAWDEESAFAVA